MNQYIHLHIVNRPMLSLLLEVYLFIRSLISMLLINNPNIFLSYQKIALLKPHFFTINAHFFVPFTIKLLDSSLGLHSHILISNSVLTTFISLHHFSAQTAIYKISNTSTPLWFFSTS